MPSSAQGVVQAYSNTPGLALTPELSQFLASATLVLLPIYPPPPPPPLLFHLQSYPKISRVAEPEGLYPLTPGPPKAAQLAPSSLLLAPCPGASHPSLPHFWGRPRVPVLGRSSWVSLAVLSFLERLGPSPPEAGGGGVCVCVCVRVCVRRGRPETTPAPRRGARSANSAPCWLSSSLFNSQVPFYSSLA